LRWHGRIPRMRNILRQPAPCFNKRDNSDSSKEGLRRSGSAISAAFRWVRLRSERGGKPGGVYSSFGVCRPKACCEGAFSLAGAEENATFRCSKSRCMPKLLCGAAHGSV
jgi:hypothetical protein